MTHDRHEDPRSAPAAHRPRATDGPQPPELSGPPVAAPPAIPLAAVEAWIWPYRAWLPPERGHER